MLKAEILNEWQNIWQDPAYCLKKKKGKAMIPIIRGESDVNFTNFIQNYIVNQRTYKKKI